MNRNDKSSLERSHSKSSNAKLTLLCLLSSIAFAGAVVFIGSMIANYLEPTIAYIGAGVCVAVVVLCLLMFSRFKR